MAEIVTKHIHCIPCDYLIEVDRFRTDEWREDLQDERAAMRIGKRRCPKCQKVASISTPKALWDRSKKPPEPIRHPNGTVKIAYERTINYD